MADPVIRSLSAEDVVKLREMGVTIREWSLSTVNRPRTDIEDEGAHGAYVALTPSDGIPAANTTTLGSATCALYLLPRPTDSDILLPEILDGVDRVVYNLSSLDVPGDTFIPIVRANSGHWLAEGETIPADGACHLASLQDTDCLLATDSNGQTTNMSPDGSGHWLSDEQLFYGAGTASGLLDFWYAAGDLHLALDGLELIQVSGSGCCWEGGPLTGHDDSPSAGNCSGVLFRICLECQPCPEDHSGTGTGTGTGTGSGTGTGVLVGGTVCCPAGLPETVFVTTPAGSFPLTWNGASGLPTDFPPNPPEWNYAGDIGTCHSPFVGHLSLFCVFDPDTLAPLHWTIEFDSSGFTSTVNSSFTNCNPVQITFGSLDMTPCSGSGSCTVTS